MSHTGTAGWGYFFKKGGEALWKFGK